MPRPERLSELYFANYRALPIAAYAGATQRLSFTVHNLEQNTTTYHYKVLALSADSSKQQTLAEGSFTLAQDGFQTTRQTIIVPALDKRTAVRVDLAYTGIAFGQDSPSLQTQSIQHWMTMTESPKHKAAGK